MKGDRMKRQAENIMITGAGSGLGRGLSLILAQKGYHILVTDYKVSEAEEVASTITAAKNSASAFYLDVTSESDILRVMNVTKDKQIDVLINNAGIQ
jgi:NAD(P)-dependent dehydrogenase (short-subunit alcohol dehydrogenase family)